MKKTHSIRRYLPTKVLDYLSKSTYPNKEHLYIICDMIKRVHNYKKEDRTYNDFVDVPSYYIRDIIRDSKYVKSAMDFLLNEKIILTDGFYSKIQKKCKGYKFNEQFISIIKSVEVQKKTITKNIINNKNERNNSVNTKFHKYRKHFLSTFKIDYDAAHSYIMDIYNSGINKCKDLKESYILIERCNSLLMCINAINDGELFFHKNKTNGRIDTNLTNMCSDLKKFITNKNLQQIDIKNSQPFFLSLLLSKNESYIDSKELSMFKDWTSSGLFYDRFAHKYNFYHNKRLTRDQVKKMMFCIFYSKNESYSKEKSIFSETFPTIYKYISARKSIVHNEFSIQLQQMESSMCIDTICAYLDLNNIKYYTIHDSWIVDKEDIDLTTQIINNCFMDKYNIKPPLSTEKI